MARASFTLPNTQRPTSGPVAISVPFDFTANPASISGDLGLEQMNGTIDFVQSIYIDNRFNAHPFVITFSGIQYTIQVRPGRQGIWPVLAANGALSFTAVSLNAGLIVPTIMFNVIQPYFTWDV